LVLTDKQIARRRDALNAERVELLDKHQVELAGIDLKLRELDQFENYAINLASDEAVAAAADAHELATITDKRVSPKPKANPIEIGKKAKRKTPSRPVPSGKKYTPEDDERILAADDGELAVIADERKTTVTAVKKRREIVREKRSAAATGGGRSLGDPVVPGPGNPSPQPGAGGGGHEAVVNWGASYPAVADPTDGGRVSPRLARVISQYDQPTPRSETPTAATTPNVKPGSHPDIKDDWEIKAPDRARLMAGR
jgi:hypothetical protein